MMQQYGTALIFVPIVAVIALAIAVGAILWARAKVRRARATARTSSTGTAGLPPHGHVPGDRQQGMWQPQSPELQSWTWSGGRAQAPDVLSGRHATYDTVVVRELSGTFHERPAFSHIRRVQNLPVMARSAPQTHWGMVAGLQARVRLPRFFVLTDQPPIIASTYVLDAAEGLTKSTGALGPGTVLWSEPQWAPAIVAALRPVLERGTPEPYLLASDGATLFVCASRGEDEQAVLRRLDCGDRVIAALEHGDERSDIR